VNYNDFQLDEEAQPFFTDFVAYFEKNYFEKVSRFTTSGFMRMKLGEVLNRTVAPHIFESQTEARRFLDEAA
jgi:propionate CoA-transferase